VLSRGRQHVPTPSPSHMATRPLAAPRPALMLAGVQLYPPAAALRGDPCGHNPRGWLRQRHRRPGGHRTLISPRDEGIIGASEAGMDFAQGGDKPAMPRSDANHCKAALALPGHPEAHERAVTVRRLVVQPCRHDPGVTPSLAHGERGVPARRSDGTSRRNGGVAVDRKGGDLRLRCSCTADSTRSPGKTRSVCAISPRKWEDR
jgi:hypothetical protein